MGWGRDYGLAGQIVQPAWDSRTTKRRGREGKNVFPSRPRRFGTSLYVGSKLAGVPGQTTMGYTGAPGVTQPHSLARAILNRVEVIIQINELVNIGYQLGGLNDWLGGLLG